MIEKSSLQPLISLRNITREVVTRSNDTRRLLNDVSWQLRLGQRVGVLSKSMQEAHALLDCAAGVATPQEGNVTIQGNVSWPLGAKGGLPSSLSGRQQAKFLQSIYGVGGQQLRELQWIERLAGLKENYFEKPLRKYNKQMRDRFHLAVALAFEFDVYIVPQQFAWKSNTTSETLLELNQALKDRTSGKSVLMTNSDFNFLEQFCDEGLVLHKGSIVYTGSFSDCRAWYEANISKAPEEDNDLQLESDEEVPTTELESDILEDDLW